MKINTKKRERRKKIYVIISNICSDFVEALELVKNHAADMLLVQNK